MSTKIEIPVFASPDCTLFPIGTLSIDRDALPKNHRFCFALAFRGGRTDNEPLEILYVFPQTDENSLKFLKKEYGE